MTQPNPADESARKAIEVRARTVDEAVARGLVRLGGLSRTEVQIEIVSAGKAGLLGFGAEEALVRLIPLAPGERSGGESDAPSAPARAKPVPAADAPPAKVPPARPAPATGQRAGSQPAAPQAQRGAGSTAVRTTDRTKADAAPRRPGRGATGAVPTAATAAPEAVSAAEADWMDEGGPSAAPIAESMASPSAFAPPTPVTPPAEAPWLEEPAPTTGSATAPGTAFAPTSAPTGPSTRTSTRPSARSSSPASTSAPARTPSPRKPRSQAAAASSEAEAIAREVTGQLLDLLGYENVTLEKLNSLLPIEIADQDKSLILSINGPGTERLLADEAKPLDALQFLARLLINRRVEDWISLMLDVGGDRARRMKELYQLAAQSATLVLHEGKPVSLPPMTAYERRVIHMALHDHPIIATQSIGQGDHRKVTVRRKDQLLPEL